jgi:hypothetical protein
LSHQHACRRKSLGHVPSASSTPVRGTPRDVLSYQHPGTLAQTQTHILAQNSEPDIGEAVRETSTHGGSQTPRTSAKNGTNGANAGPSSKHASAHACAAPQTTPRVPKGSRSSIEGTHAHVRAGASPHRTPAKSAVVRGSPSSHVQGGTPQCGRGGDVWDAEAAKDEVKALRAQLSSVRSQVRYAPGSSCHLCAFSFYVRARVRVRMKSTRCAHGSAAVCRLTRVLGACILYMCVCVCVCMLLIFIHTQTCWSVCKHTYGSCTAT